MLIIPNSRSIVLRSAQIVLVRVEASRPQPSIPRQEGGVQRDVELELRIEEVLKGQLAEGPGSTVRLVVHQRGTGTTRVAAQPGVWSNQVISTGARYLAFARLGATHAAEALGDPICERLTPAEGALADLRLSVDAAQARPSPDALLADARTHVRDVGQLFLEYLWVRLGDRPLAKPGVFQGLADLLANPGLSLQALGLLVNQLDEALMALDPPPQDEVRRFARALFDLAASPRAESLRESIIGNDLRSLLGIDGSAPSVTPSEVFGSDAAARAKALRAAEEVRDQGGLNASDAAAVAAWFRAP
jgi:hypothetical protein